MDVMIQLCQSLVNPPLQLPITTPFSPQGWPPSPKRPRQDLPYERNGLHHHPYCEEQQQANRLTRACSHDCLMRTTTTTSDPRRPFHLSTTSQTHRHHQSTLLPPRQPPQPLPPTASASRRGRVVSFSSDHQISDHADAGKRPPSYDT